MARRCYMLAAVAMVFSVCFQTRVSCTNNVTGSDTVCNTPECISTAATMLRKMNLAADPCQDFNEYACGRYIAETVIPDGVSSISPIDVLKAENKLFLRDILNNTDPNEPPYTSKPRGYFRSCMNEDQIEAVGLTPYLNDHTFSDDWPTLNPNWSEANFDLNDSISRYAAVFVTPLFTISMWKNMFGDKIALHIRHGSLGLHSSYLSQGRNSSQVKAYLNYLVEFAVALNVSRSVAEQDASQVVDLEIEIDQIKSPLSHKYSDMYKQIKLEEAEVLYPRIDIVRALKALFSAFGLTLADDDVIVLVFPTYLEDLDSVLARFPKRTIQNLFGFKYALFRLEGLTRRLRQIKLAFDQVTQGIATEQPRWKYCVESTSQTLWEGISKQFVNRKFSETAKNKVNEMIDELKEAFKQMIEQVTWMGNSTKATALRKLAAMTRFIGYPAVDFDDAYLERLYENLTIREDNFYNNRKIGKQKAVRETLNVYGQLLKNLKWYIHPCDVLGYYTWINNEIGFTAGIIQPPYFSVSYPDYVSYGSMGLLLGNEIIQAFDSRGSDMDDNVLYRNWWTNEDRNQFNNRTQCIADHFSQFHSDENNVTVNGDNVRITAEGEIGGLKASLRAYKQHVLTHGQQPRLPDLNLTQDQLFFLAYAQTHCAKMTPQALRSHVTKERNPPAKYRIIGTLQNSEDFARAYNCALGSYMNPEQKCNVW